MQLSRCGLSPQRQSPESDYDYEHPDGTIQTPRRPLGKSAGNTQQQTLGSPSYCQSRQLPLSPLHSISTSPILPTHSLASAYGSSVQDHHSVHSDGSFRESSLACIGGSRNPIYSWKHFADYRAKVTQKESENEDPTWPLYLEDAFLDALLLIPFMGRKKISCKGRLYGRNMLLTEYLWICHWLLFPPSPGEIVPVGKDRERHPMFRGRKQVSSHIQVLKGFFISHPCFHFFFPQKNDERDDSKRHMKEDEGDIESLKNHKVLVALAEGRLPDARPNYEYFARLLTADSEVFVRPKTCWIYVSSSEVTLSSDFRVARSSDGTVLSADAYTADGQRLDCAGDYPHIVLNSNKETRRDLRNGRDDEAPKYLLHEYTRALTQKESSSVRDISAKWAHQFPDLRDSLLAALNEIDPSHESTSRCVVGPCDTIQFEVVLDLHSTSRFPSGTHLEGSVQLQICHPELANHCWRSVTGVSKPQELEHENEEPFWNRVNSCELVSRQKDVIEVPFPAKSWASTFFRLATYGESVREFNGLCYKMTSDDGNAGAESRHSNGPKPLEKIYTTEELLEQVAMYQEIWSAPNDGSENPRWARRAIILWTFKNVHTKTDDKGKTASVPPGTNWRFLTKIDPTSQAHQQNTYISGSSPGAPTLLREANMSLDPTYTSHATTAAIHRNFNNTSHNTTPNNTMVADHSLHPYHTSTFCLMDGSSSGGLSTSALTGPISPSYAHSLDNTTMSSADNLYHDANYLTHGSENDSSGTLVAGSSSHNSTDLFELDVPVVNNIFDETFDHQTWASTSTRSLGSLDQWGTTYGNSQHGLSWADSTTGLEPIDVCSRSTTPWGDMQDNMWTATDHSAATVPADLSQQQHNNTWATTTTQNWLQSTGGTADTIMRKNDHNMWDRHDLQSVHARHHQHHMMTSSPSLTASPSTSLRSAPDRLREQVSFGKQHHRDQRLSGRGSTPQHVSGEPYGTDTVGRKRERTVDDETDEDRERYPYTSMHKSVYAHTTTTSSKSRRATAPKT